MEQHLGQPYDRRRLFHDAYHYHDVRGLSDLWFADVVHRGSVPRAVWDPETLVLLCTEILLVWGRI